jgi:hypothetical protein
MAELSWDTPIADVRRLLARRQVVDFYDRKRVEAIHPQDALDWEPLVDSREWVLDLRSALAHLLAGKQLAVKKDTVRFFNRWCYRVETACVEGIRVCRMELKCPEPSEPWGMEEAQLAVDAFTVRAVQKRMEYADLLLAWAWAHRPGDGLSDQILREGKKLLNYYDGVVRTFSN